MSDVSCSGWFGCVWLCLAVFGPMYWLKFSITLGMQGLFVLRVKLACLYYNSSSFFSCQEGRVCEDGGCQRGIFGVAISSDIWPSYKAAHAATRRSECRHNSSTFCDTRHENI